MIVSPFDYDIPMVTRNRVHLCKLKVNKLIDEIVLEHITKGGMLEEIFIGTKKEVVVLDK